MDYQAALQFIDTVEHENEADTLIERYTRFTQALGFKAYILTGLPAVGSNVEPLIISSNWPESWLSKYREKQYFLTDPVARWARSKQHAFRWTDAIAAVPGGEMQEVVKEAVGFGFIDGIAIPLKTDRMWKVVASLAADHRLGWSNSDLAQIETATSYFYQRHEDLTSKSTATRPALTRRELETLRLCADGKSAWEIGQIMRISETTAISHRKSATRKLGCTTTVQAVVKAIESGLLQS